MHSVPLGARSGAGDQGARQEREPTKARDAVARTADHHLA
jgi:hypothetical protein